jgi:hypothetical protein
VFDPAVDEGPFRGATKHVEVLNPEFEAATQAEKDRDYQRGTRYLWIGFAVLATTVAGVLWATSGGQTMRERVDAVLMSLGLGVFPFALGLFFAIKGTLLRNQ